MTRHRGPYAHPSPPATEDRPAEPADVAKPAAITQQKDTWQTTTCKPTIRAHQLLGSIVHLTVQNQQVGRLPCGLHRALRRLRGAASPPTKTGQSRRGLPPRVRHQLSAESSHRPGATP